MEIQTCSVMSRIGSLKIRPTESYATAVGISETALPVMLSQMGSRPRSCGAARIFYPSRAIMGSFLRRKTSSHIGVCDYGEKAL